MFLKELEIQGFKSFPDKTHIKIEKGITVVVGPNGSGKSNISDSIRWVLGETSSRQLRGTGKMEDVIFGGTQQRGAMGFAAVTLRIDNTDRQLDVDADEVAIGRRYYRSGQSDYTINGQNVRLKDVYELLLDTGIGRDGYSVIGQGRIAEIVGAKSNERREIFEEASGIAKYRYRKTEAERRLENTEANLERLRDILGELEGRVGPLKRESEKAQKFLELSARCKELEVTLWVNNIHRAMDTVRDQQRKYETAQADYDRMTADIEAVDTETEQSRAESQRLSVEIERLNAEIRAVTEEMSGSESQLAVLNNDIRHNREGIASREEELRQSGQSDENIREEIASHEKEISQLEQREVELDADIARAADQLETIQADSLKTGERRGAVTAAMARLTEQQTAARVTAAGASGSVAAARERLTTARTEQEAAAQNAQNLSEEAAENQKYLEGILQNATRLQNIRQGLSLKLESRRASLKACDENEQTITREMEAARQRLSVLKEMERNMEGYQQSVKTVMLAGQAHRLRGILGTVSSILTVKPGYELAIETALGYALQNIVVEGESAAKAAIAFLSETRKGRATFLPLDTVKGSVFNGPLSGSAVPAASLVTYDARYSGIVGSILGRIIVVDDLNEASRVARSLGYRNKIVTVDGQVVNAGGSFTGGSTSRSAGLFSRRQEIDELKNRVEKLNAKLEQAQEDTDRWKAEVDNLSAQLMATDSEAITVGGDKIRAEMESQRLQKAGEQAQETARHLTAELQTLESQIAQSSAAAEKAAAEDERLGAELEKFTAELTELSAGDDSFLATRTRLSDELSGRRMERLAAEKDVGLHKAAIETLRSRTGENSLRVQELKANIETLTKCNLENEAKIRGIEAACEDCRSRIAQKEDAIKAASTRRMEKEAALTQSNQKTRTLTDEREKMGQEMVRLSERKTAAEQEYDQTVAKLWEAYQLTQQQATELCVEFETVTELRRNVSEVHGKIRALGNVNVAAIDEYKEVSERYEFLAAQVGDVEKSKSELVRLIAQLSSEMREIFSQNFKIINENFGRIFRELFGGGSASLTLTDEENVLESGIEITVAPPGKVIKNLSALSGGEQALVAISIYFAILAVNPSPFCILDEIEAALDDVNVVRYAQYLQRITDKTQFIVITHRRGTMEAADMLYGVTMQENGISKLLRLNLDEVDAALVSG